MPVKQAKLTKKGLPDKRGRNPKSLSNLKKGQEIIQKSFKRSLGADESGEDESDSDESFIEPADQVDYEEIRKTKPKPKRKVIYEEDESEPEEEVVLVRKRSKPKIKEEPVVQPVVEPVKTILPDYARTLEEERLKHREELEMLKKDKEEAVKLARLGRIQQMKSSMICKF